MLCCSVKTTGFGNSISLPLSLRELIVAEMIFVLIKAVQLSLTVRLVQNDLNLGFGSSDVATGEIALGRSRFSILL